ncbi:hypothetical protein PanWU01x14_091750 [Parasponia andersonii]|uniref:Transmembrane protein n=1 Tax=Parasponia andersonii TaxID=3476 RepID=A0A2P5D6L1_PARAD|nr:hypothetical protein PanWU01x14_091750 [Parasponia andersonii]
MYPIAIFSKFYAVLVIAIFFANFHTTYSTSSMPTISASPAVLPYVMAPNMSSFFPSPRAQQPAASPHSEAFAPVPSSGEFVGRVSSAESNKGVALSYGGFCALFVLKLVYAN